MTPSHHRGIRPGPGVRSGVRGTESRSAGNHPGPVMLVYTWFMAVHTGMPPGRRTGMYQSEYVLFYGTSWHTQAGTYRDLWFRMTAAGVHTK